MKLDSRHPGSMKIWGFGKHGWNGDSPNFAYALKVKSRSSKQKTHDCNKAEQHSTQPIQSKELSNVRTFPQEVINNWKCERHM